MKRTKDLNQKNVGADASVHLTSKARQNKGITLIALVITIIVMLILVAVTISMAINGGLFDYAGKATGDTKNAIDTEQELAKLEENLTVDELIDKYTGVIKGVDLNLLNIGDYVNYQVEYTNVATSDNGYVPEDKFASKWRVLSKVKDEDGNVLYIKLVSAGVPLTFFHYDKAETSINNLTTGFLETAIDSTERGEFKFLKCGFSVGENDENLYNVFFNEVTEKYTDNVQALTMADVNEILGVEDGWSGDVTDEQYMDLLAVPCKGSSQGEYAITYIASEFPGDGYGSQALCTVDSDGSLRGEGMVAFSFMSYPSPHGVRVVVTLKPTVNFNTASEKINDTATWDIF